MALVSRNNNHILATEQAIEYMKSHLEEEVTSEGLAEHVGYSPFHFTRIFKEVTGVSPRHYLSALRIESGKAALLKEPSLLIKVLMSIGFRSVGSFNTRFKHYVGMSPKKFRTSSSALSTFLNAFEKNELMLAISEKNPKSQIRCHIEAPASFHGIIFVGLFRRPIPDERPIKGTALNGQHRTCTFANVPPGTYYALAAGIAWSLNPRDYFVLDHAPRGMYPSEIIFTENTDLNITIQLREPLPTDPPIVVNLPLLLFEQNTKK